MKLFNQQRRKLMTGNRIQKYILYAIGEIILVVIGILIAVNINNFNENKKLKDSLTNILKIYKKDLETDTLVSGQIKIMLDEKKRLFSLFINDTVSIDDYKQNPAGYGLVISLVPFKLQQKGIKLLENYAKMNDSDSLVTSFIASHNAFNSIIEDTQNRISDDVSDNMYYLKNNEPWIGDLLQGKTNNPDLQAYYLSKKYKGRLAIHSTLVIGNLLTFIDRYRDYAKESIKKIETVVSNN